MILTDHDFSYIVFKDLRRYNVLIGNCEWTDKTKYKQQMYQKNKQEINTNVISKIWASEQTLQKMDSEKVIYGKLYYHFNNFCSL